MAVKPKAQQTDIAKVKTKLLTLKKAAGLLAINKEMDALATAQAVDYAKLMALYQEANTLADEVKKSIGVIYDYIRTIALPSKMEADGIDSPFNVAGIGRIVLTDDIRVSVLDKDLEYHWLEANGHKDLISRTVNAASLAALLRRYMRDGKEIPEPVFKVTPFCRASITGLKKSETKKSN